MAIDARVAVRPDHTLLVAGYDVLGSDRLVSHEQRADPDLVWGHQFQPEMAAMGSACDLIHAVQ